MHICSNKSIMKSVQRLQEVQKIYLLDGSSQLIEFTGCVVLNSKLLLENVLLAPTFTHNLISVAQLVTEMGVRSTFLDTHCVIQKKSEDSIVCLAQAVGKLYVVNPGSHYTLTMLLKLVGLMCWIGISC